MWNRLVMPGALVLAILAAGCAATAVPDADGPLAPRPGSVFPGEVRASHRWAAAFGVSGRLVRVNVREGERIEAGTIVAEIDGAPFASSATSSEEALESAKARLAMLGNYMRPEDVRAFLPSVVSYGAADSLRSSVLAAEIAQATAATRLRHDRWAASATQLRASASGRVTGIRASPGDLVGAGQAVVEMEDDRVLEIAARIPPSLLSSVRAGRRALIDLTDEGGTVQSLHARVVRAAPREVDGEPELVLIVVERSRLSAGTRVRVRIHEPEGRSL